MTHSCHQTGVAPRLKLKLFDAWGDDLQTLAMEQTDVAGPHRVVVEGAIDRLPVRPDIIVHRVVHGGGRLPALTRVDAGSAGYPARAYSGRTTSSTARHFRVSRPR